MYRYVGALTSMLVDRVSYISASGTHPTRPLALKNVSRFALQQNFKAPTQTTSHSRRTASDKLSHTRCSLVLFSSLSRCSALAAGPAFRLSSRTSVFDSKLSLILVPTRTYAKSRKKMPPKKEVKQEKILLGRPGNSLKSGIVCEANMCVLCASALFNR